MKYLVKFFVITFLLLNCTLTLAEQTIVVLDMKYVLNNSKAGKGVQEHLKKTFNKNNEKFTSMEKELKKKESDLLAKKTIYSKEEYKKKSDGLRKEVIKYQSERRTSLEKIAKQRTESKQTLLKALNPILDAYINENDISIVMDKKNQIGGLKKYDITEIIVEKLNKKLPSISLK